MKFGKTEGLRKKWEKLKVCKEHLRVISVKQTVNDNIFI